MKATHQSLISVLELTEHLGDPGWVIVDCRFSITDPAKGRQDYLQSHIPGAVYAHLDHDLSGPIHKGITGRHPLPEVGLVVDKISKMGIGPGVQVIAYVMLEVHSLQPGCDGFYIGWVMTMLRS